MTMITGVKPVHSWFAAEKSPLHEMLAKLAQHIESRDGEVMAWEMLDLPSAQRAAGNLKAASERNAPLLGGIFGIKDNIDVAGLATRNGSKARDAWRMPEQDAAVIAKLKKAGGVILGKTRMTEHAFRDPAPTRNPYNLEHTPGGSSSGSAAAVAAGMVPFALGTQTAGSVNRPGSYCGVATFKPSYRLIDLTGITPLAPSFDTIGIFARWFPDIQAIFRALDDNAHETLGSASPRLGAVDPRFFGDADEESKAHYAEMIAFLRGAGWRIEGIGIPFDNGEMNALHQHVMLAEMGDIFGPMLLVQQLNYQPLFRTAVEEGTRISTAAKNESLARIAEIREGVWRDCADLDATLLLAVPAPAPKGLSSTGDQRLISPWTAMHGPMATIPTRLSKQKLPLSLMITCRPGADHALVAHAIALQDQIDHLPAVAPLFDRANDR